MDTMPKQSKSLTLKNLSWSEYLVLFNKKHNPLMTSVGTVEVKVQNEEFDPNGLPKNFTDKYQG